jgi:hypothetical protein
MLDSLHPYQSYQQEESQQQRAVIHILIPKAN